MARQTTKKTTQQVQQVRDEATVASVAGINIDKVSQDLAATGVDIQKTLADVGIRVNGALRQLADAEAAIVLKKTELQTLYSIEAGAVTLDELNAQLEELRAIIAREREQAEREAAESLEETERTRARAQDQYDYDTAQRRRKDEDAFKAKLAADHQKHSDSLIAANKALYDRENVIKAAEAELKSLRDQVAGHPAALEKAVKTAEAIKEHSVKRHYETEQKLLQKDIESAKLVADQRLAAAEAANVALRSDNERLRKETEQARADVKDISTKALESSAVRQSQPQFVVTQPAEERTNGRK